ISCTDRSSRPSTDCSLSRWIRAGTYGWKWFSKAKDVVSAMAVPGGSQVGEGRERGGGPGERAEGVRPRDGRSWLDVEDVQAVLEEERGVVRILQPVHRPDRVVRGGDGAQQGEVVDRRVAVGDTERLLPVGELLTRQEAGRAA